MISPQSSWRVALVLTLTLLLALTTSSPLPTNQDTTGTDVNHTPITPSATSTTQPILTQLSTITLPSPSPTPKPTLHFVHPTPHRPSVGKSLFSYFLDSVDDGVVRSTKPKMKYGKEIVEEKGWVIMPFRFAGGLEEKEEEKGEKKEENKEKKDEKKDKKKEVNEEEEKEEKKNDKKEDNDTEKEKEKPVKTP